MISKMVKALLFVMLGAGINVQAVCHVVSIGAPMHEVRCPACEQSRHTCDTYHVQVADVQCVQCQRDREESADLATRLAAGIFTGAILLSGCWLFGIPVDGACLRCAIVLSMLSRRESVCYHPVLLIH